MKKFKILMILILTLCLVGCGSNSNNSNSVFGRNDNERESEEKDNTNVNNDKKTKQQDNTNVNNDKKTTQQKNTNVDNNKGKVTQKESDDVEFIKTINEFIEAVKIKVEEDSGNFYSGDDTETELILVPVGNKHISSKGFSCVETNSGGNSPYSDTWNYAFVGVTYDKVGWTYFFVGEDSSGHGVSFVTYDELKNVNNAVKYIYSSSSDKAYSDSIYGKKASMNNILHDNLVRVYRDKATRWYSGKPTEYSKIPESEGMVKLASVVDIYYDKEYIVVNGSCME